jgi:hypothetical protein
MSATFEIKITAIRTSDFNGLTGVVRQVDFTVKGTQEGQTFELPQTVQFDEAFAGAFIALEDLTKANVIGFVEQGFTNMEAVEAHIQFVLDKEIAKASLQSTPLPWSAAE